MRYELSCYTSMPSPPRAHPIPTHPRTPRFISLGRGEKTRHGDEVWTASVAKQFGCIIKLFKDLGVDGVVSPTSAPVDEKEDDVVPPFGDIAKAYYDSQGDFAGTFEMHIDTVSEPSEVSDTVVRVLIRYKFKPVAGKQVNCLRYGGSSPNHGWDSRVFEFQKPSGDGSTVLLKMHGYKSAQAELPVPE